ncbi:MAG TPA: ABC transporter permease [Gemmatimonadaceae bacterium]|nr:ABC transporter permease [Gemmatimonadaceae bacterium]
MLERLRYRLRTLPFPARHAREAERELRFHLDLEAAQREHDGASASDAAFAARRQLGNRTAVAESVRRVAGLGWIDATRQDLAFAMRGIRRAPTFSIVAAATLALGIGAATAIYAVVDAVLLRPLPIAHADRVLDLELVRRAPSGNSPAVDPVSVPEYLRWRDKLHSFSAIAGHSPTRAMLLGAHPDTKRPWWLQSKANQVQVTPVTPNFFPLVGAAPILGRAFATGGDAAADDRTAVLSYAYWQNIYGSDPHAIGRTIVLDGESYTIIGVMPRHFVFPQDTQLWTSETPEIERFKSNEYTFMLGVIGRLRDGVSETQALTELRTMYPADTVGNRALGTYRVDAPRIRDALVASVKTYLAIMTAFVAVLLLVASANVTNMLLVRGTSRRQEIAIRLALGAGRERIVRQLITESLMLAGLGAVAGMSGAALLTHFLSAADALDLPGRSLIAIDPSVLLAGAIAAVSVGIVCGLVPALSVSRDAIETTMRTDAARHSAGRRRRRLRDALVVGQVSLSVVLLAGAGLLVQTLHHLMELRPGINADGVLTGDIQPGYPSTDTVARVLAAGRIAERLRALPNVADASVSTTYPFGGNLSFRDLRIPGRTLPDSANAYSITAGIDRHYFTTVGVRLLRGRAFTTQDPSRRDVAIVNDALVEKFFGSLDPIGNHITLAGWPVPLEIVGVVQGTRIKGDDRLKPTTFVPIAAEGAQNLAVTVRVAHGDPAAAAPAVERAVEQAAPGSHMYYVSSLNALMGFEAQTPHLYLLILGGFAIAALVVTAVGLYGVISYSVAQRTREIGIRIALGATPNTVRRRVTGQGLGLTLTGVAAGAALSIAATRILRSLLFGVAPGDPTVLALVALLLAAVALLACWLPARRAAAVDPLIAIRTE